MWLRRLPPAGVGQTLGAARLHVGLGLREAARQVGITHPYLLQLENGQRCPSVTVARKLVEVLELSEQESAALLAAAVGDAGRDHPARRAA